MLNRLITSESSSLVVPSFFDSGDVREGTAVAAQLPRLAVEAVGPIALHWRATGGRVPRHVLPAYADQPQLTLEIEGTLAVACQRCLTPVDVVIEVQRTFVVFESDALADDALLDNDQFDAIAGRESVDILPLIEDEVLLLLEDGALHVQCPAQALAALGLSEVGDHVVHVERAESPFAALAALKKG